MLADWLNTMHSFKNKAEVLVVEPGNGNINIGKARRQKQRIMRALIKPDLDFTIGESHQCQRINKVAEDVARFGRVITFADLLPQEPAQTAAHQRQLQIAGDLQRHTRGERINMKEVDSIGNSIFDDHPLSI